MSVLSVLLAVQTLGSPPQIEIPDWENAVQFELVASQSPVRPGDAFEIALVAEIEPGYHLYGPEEAAPSRTTVTVVGGSLEAGKPDYPPVIRRDLSGLGEYDLYEGRIAIRIPVGVPKTHGSGDIEASVRVAYQICTDFACSAPASDVLTLKLPGGKTGAPVKSLHPKIFKKE